MLIKNNNKKIDLSSLQILLITVITILICLIIVVIYLILKINALEQAMAKKDELLMYMGVILDNMSLDLIATSSLVLFGYERLGQMELKRGREYAT